MATGLDLFVCVCCSCLDSKNEIKPGKLENKPNMSSWDMLGKTDKVIKVSRLGSDDSEYGVGVKLKTYKEAREIKLLCSECNTGIWHNKFSKVNIKDSNGVNKLIQELNNIDKGRI